MKKEFLAAIIALILTVSSAAVITGCGCNNDKNDEKSTTAPATTVASSTEKTTKSNKKATQPSTQKSTNSQSDLQTIALNSYGVSAADGYSAVQTGSTNVSEGTYNIFAVYDSNGNLKTYVYIHTSGAPVFVGQDVFESNHGGNTADNQGGGNAQDGGNNQDNGGGQDSGNQNSVSNQDGGGQSSNQGGNQGSNQGSNQGGNQGGGNPGYGGGGNQGGDGHDYADKGY